MTHNNDDILAQIEPIINQIAKDKGDAVAQEIHRIVKCNIPKNRHTTFLNANKHHTLKQYLDNIVYYYDQYAPFIKSLQIDHDTATWQVMCTKIRKWAYSLLYNWSLSPHEHHQYTIDIAQEVSINLLKADYTYDVVFDAWAYTLTKFTLYKFMRKQKHLVKTASADLNEILDTLYLIEHDTNVEKQVAQKDLINHYLKQLTPPQQEVIIAHYLKGQTFGAISQQTTISKNTLYKRHHDAIQSLRKILEKEGHKDE
ncbi:MAG TPA: RNA polymerase sigma factor [Anaerolineae bacterium]|nr:RNA polymerase sigma factor [Anaerolineae bacterium]